MNQLDALLVAVVLYGAIAWNIWGRRATKSQSQGSKPAIDPGAMVPEAGHIMGPIIIAPAIDRRKGFVRGEPGEANNSKPAADKATTLIRVPDNINSG